MDLRGDVAQNYVVHVPSQKHTGVSYGRVGRVWVGEHAQGVIDVLEMIKEERSLAAWSTILPTHPERWLSHRLRAVRGIGVSPKVAVNIGFASGWNQPFMPSKYRHSRSQGTHATKGKMSGSRLDGNRENRHFYSLVGNPLT